MNTNINIAQHSNTDVGASDNAFSSQPIRISIDFGTVEQARLFERFVKRITRSDLQALMFGHSESEALLTVLGEVRAPLKSISKNITGQP